MSGRLILVTSVGEAAGARAAAAALACAAAEPEDVGLLIDLAGARGPRPGLFATPAAQRLEERLAAHRPDCGVASRGRLCVLALDGRAGGLEQLPGALAVGREAPTAVHVPPPLFRPVIESAGVLPGAALLCADLSRDRALAALAAADLIRRGLRVAVLKQPLGWLAARGALAGVPLPQATLPTRLVARLKGVRELAA